MRAHLAGRQGELEMDLSAFNVLRRREAARLIERGGELLAQVPTTGGIEKSDLEDTGLEAFRKGTSLLITDKGFPPWRAIQLLMRIEQGELLCSILRASTQDDKLAQCTASAQELTQIACDNMYKTMTREVSIDDLLQKTSQLHEAGRTFRREVRRSRACGCAVQ
jgi:hypothetical protein